MNKTLKISFSLKNTYRVNTILYSLKQIPLLKKVLPESLYKVKAFKILANIFSFCWEIISVFLGKFIYLAFMICEAGLLYSGSPKRQTFLHLLLLLTIMGDYLNTSVFNPSKDKYYAMILMRMNAKEYTLVNYLYSTLKVIIGFLPFTLWFGVKWGLPVWLCILLPFSIAGSKLAFTSVKLQNYEKGKTVYSENSIGNFTWLFTGILLGITYGLPALGITLPELLSAGILLIFIPAGLIGLKKVLSFGSYREVNQQLLFQTMNQMDAVANMTKEMSQKNISADLSINSSREGFEYLNDLFIKRHQKILWKSTKRIAIVCTCLISAVILALHLQPAAKKETNELILTWLPYFVWIMYCINRGTDFTKALFMNCDHSLLTYSFYKQPGYILKLFQIRLREIIKINVYPAFIIGIGLVLILCFSGGTKNPVNYLVILISILCMSIFFSIHHLTIYYLLQPFNSGTEVKSGTYRIVTSLTYILSFFMMKLHMSTLIFGIMTIVFCIIYSIAACILVYKLAPKTFRLRT